MEFRSLVIMGVRVLRLHLEWMWRTYVAVVFLVVVCASAVWLALFSPPVGFPVGHLITVEEGQSLPRLALSLERDRLIRYPLIFELLVRASDKAETVQAGKYLFVGPEDVFTVARRIMAGDSGIHTARITLREGITTRDMADIFSAQIPDFDRSRFIATATPQEGYLFPDTYFFYPNESVDEIVTTLRTTFDDKIASIEPQMRASGKSFSDLVIMASLLEGEAKTLEERRVVAGILYNRLRIGMPLQVDAVFSYIRGVSGYVPTGDDLTSDSPYNTYRHKGLPPGPINNPGLDSLLAAATPIKSEYLYYLHGDDGNIYYAKTFETHKRNKELYLK